MQAWVFALILILVLALALALPAGFACREETPATPEGSGDDGASTAEGEEPAGGPSSRPGAGRSRWGAFLTRQVATLVVGPAERLARGLKPAFYQAIRDRAESPAFCVQRAEAALTDGDPAAACRYLRRALAIAPGHRDALRALAVALSADGRYEQAIEAYRKLLTTAPAEPVSLFNLAVAYSRLGRGSLAEATYRRLLASHDDHARGWYNLATILQAAGKVAEAAEAWQRAIALSPGEAEAHAHYGEVLMDLHRPGDAVKAFAAAAHAEADRVSHWANLALAAGAAGQYARSAAGYRRAVSLDRSDPRMWRRLGSALLAVHRLSGQPEPLAEAVAAWRESLALQPDQPEVARWVQTHSTAQPKP